MSARRREPDAGPTYGRNSVIPPAVTCFVEDEPFATCDAEDACVEVYASALRAKECCDF